MKMLGSSLKLFYACTSFTAAELFNDVSSLVICQFFSKFHF